MDTSRFLKVYANLPVKLREQIVIVIEDIPMSWNAVYLEMKKESELAKQIYEKLVEMEII